MSYIVQRNTRFYVVAGDGLDPGHGCRRSGESSERRSWTLDELTPFLTAARSQRRYPALHLTAHTGMRRGEIVGLKWSDLDVGRRRRFILRTVQCVGGQPVEFGVKTRTSRRTVELDHHTVEVLERWRRRLQRDGLPHTESTMACSATQPVGSSTPNRSVNCSTASSDAST